jgi:hypothetical protein
MLRSDWSQVWTFRAARSLAVILFALIALAFIPAASAQTFTLQMNKFQPFAVAPSQTAASSIVLSPNPGFTGSVTLSCTVAAVAPTSSTVNPECQMSPPSVTPPAGATATVITVFDGTAATPGTYTISVTGTSTADGTTVSESQPITVLAVTGQFNLSLSTVLTPSSVQAGSGAEATISVNPVNSYSGQVTLACATITPLVAWPPTCSFSYPGGTAQQPATSATVMSGIPTLVTMTISTSLNNPDTHQRVPYALWLPAPMLAVLGFSRKRSRKVLGVLAIFVLSASILLIPACNHTTYTTPDYTGTTPDDTYTITLIGTDQSGNISTNTGTTATTVSLTVTSPTD